MPNAFRTQLLDMVEYTDYVATFAEPGREIVDIDNWTYFVDGETLSADITATAAQVFLTPMAGDNDFVLFYMAGMGRVTGTTVLSANPALLVQIADLTTGRTFFSAPSPMPMIAGCGGFPYMLPGPKVIPPRSTLRTTVVSAQAQAFSGFYFCFHGSRIWYGD